MRGSHTKKRLRHKLTLLIGQPDDRIANYYGPENVLTENVLTVTGPRGLVNAEDPMCFHKWEGRPVGRG